MDFPFTNLLLRIYFHEFTFTNHMIPRTTMTAEKITMPSIILFADHFFLSIRYQTASVRQSGTMAGIILSNTCYWMEIAISPLTNL